REGTTISPGTLEFPAGDLVERAPVVDSRQVVGAGQRALSLMCPIMQEPDVAERQQERRQNGNVPGHGAGRPSSTGLSDGSPRGPMCVAPLPRVAGRRSGDRRPCGARTGPRPLRVAGRGPCGGPDPCVDPNRAVGAGRVVWWLCRFASRLPLHDMAGVAAQLPPLPEREENAVGPSALQVRGHYLGLATIWLSCLQYCRCRMTKSFGHYAGAPGVCGRLYH